MTTAAVLAIAFVVACLVRGEIRQARKALAWQREREQANRRIA